MNSPMHSPTAASAEARVIAHLIQQMQGSAERSVVLLGEKADVISRIRDLVAQCAETDWDGYGAEPVSPLAAELAEDLVRLLPDGTPLPGIAPEPDGSISLDWAGSKHRSVTMSAGPRGRIAYAWADGPNTGRGVFSPAVTLDGQSAD